MDKQFSPQVALNNVKRIKRKIEILEAGTLGSHSGLDQILIRTEGDGYQLMDQKMFCSVECRVRGSQGALCLCHICEAWGNHSRISGSNDSA